MARVKAKKPSLKKVKAQEKALAKLKAKAATKHVAIAKPLPSRPPLNPSEVLPPPCVHCGRIHHGNQEESIVAIDPVAAVYYDRDVAPLARVAGLCGPRFRPVDPNNPARGLRAHFGFPYDGKNGYAIYQWEASHLLWLREIPAMPISEARQDFADLLSTRILDQLPSS